MDEPRRILMTSDLINALQAAGVMPPGYTVGGIIIEAQMGEAVLIHVTHVAEPNLIEVLSATVGAARVQVRMHGPTAEIPPRRATDPSEPVRY